MKTILKLSAILIALCTLQPAYGQRTTRHKLKALPADVVCDTIFTSADSTVITFSGYEKTLRSSRESFFVTNRSDSIVDRLSLEITYFDMAGHLLDKRVVAVDVELPPSETRKVDLRSWDTQKVMYYHRSPQPRGGVQATPYRVRIRLLAACRR